MPKRFSAFVIILLLITLTALASGCNKPAAPALSGDTETDAPADDTADAITGEAEGETEAISEAPAQEMPETDASATEKPFDNVPSGDKMGEVKTTDKPINPLTGLAGTAAQMKSRPAAVMINNIKQACPQVGISRADVIYEMMAEGGITRLMMVVSDYANLGVIGSVRSSREYYVDMAQNHDAIYIHAGGASTAYDAIQSRKINNLDGVNMYTPSTFYRDAARASSMGLEHSLMTSGEGIVSGISYKKYRTTLKDGFSSPLHFVDYNASPIVPTGGEAKHIIIPYNKYTFPQYIYRPSEGVYSRYQFNGKPHIDGETGEILTFSNILVLCCKHSYSGDSYGHIGVDTTGSGDGYFFSQGSYAKIRWSKASVDEPFVLTCADGSPLYLNCGKTFINIVDPTVFANITFNYSH